MEGKTVILSVLIMSLVMTQNQVEAMMSCCPDTIARDIYYLCRVHGGSMPRCAFRGRCEIIYGKKCPPEYPYDGEGPEKSGDTVNEYCKLGCASSVCGALTTLQDSDASAQCTNACSNFCTKGSANAVEIA